MEKYLIVTDTTSAMNKEIAAAHGIELISLSVIVDGQEYKDQVDISTEQLYDYLKDGKTPSTSQPNPGYLIEKMEAWQKENYEAIIVVTCSADLSGTNNGFHLAKDTVGLDNVYIYDSRQVGAPVMDMAIRAKQLADEGKDVDEIFKVLEEKTKGFRKDLPTLLFVGGSAGARVFNEFVTEHQAELLQHYNIINLTGDSTLNQAEGGLYRVDYVTDQYLPMLQKADLVVTRGGANTLFELLAMNKLHLIVPLGKEASRGDQIENAQYFVDKGYSEQLQEDQLTLETFNETIQEMLKQSQVYHQAMEKSTELLSLDDFYGLLQKDISKGKDDGRQ